MGDPLVYPRVGRVRGSVARSATWWGRAWVRTFEETVVDVAELTAGRALARSGRLGAVMVLAGMAQAQHLARLAIEEILTLTGARQPPCDDDFLIGNRKPTVFIREVQRHLGDVHRAAS